MRRLSFLFDNPPRGNRSKQATVCTRPCLWLGLMIRDFFKKLQCLIALALVVALSSVPALAGITVSGADGILAFGPNGITTSGADGITVTGADGSPTSGADGITTSGADGIAVTGADSTTLTRADGITVSGAD